MSRSGSLPAGAPTTLQDPGRTAASGSQSQSTALPGLLGRDDDRGMMRRATELLAHGEVTIVVFGHTHLLVDHAPFGADDPRRVFNTGSWMPRLDVEGLPRPTFRDLAPLDIGAGVRPSFARASRIRIRRSIESGAGMPPT